MTTKLTQDILELAVRKMTTLFHQNQSKAPSALITELVISFKHTLQLSSADAIHLELLLIRIALDDAYGELGRL